MTRINLNTQQWIALIVLLLAVFWIIFGPRIIVSPALEYDNHSKYDFRETGQIGDTIGGITAPIIGLVSAILLYLSFSAQIQANATQREANRITQEEANFKYILDEFDKVKSTFDNFTYFSKDHTNAYVSPEMTGMDALSTFSFDLNNNIQKLQQQNWEYYYDVERANYLFQNYSLFINEASTVNLSINQKQIVQAKIWLYQAEHLNDFSQIVGQWKVDNPTKLDDQKIFKNQLSAFQHKLLILDIARRVAPFKNSILTINI